MSLLLLFAGATTGGGPPPPPPGIDSGSVGSGHFSRGQWHTLKKKWQAEEEVIARAAEATGRKERDALNSAAVETAKARAAVQVADAEYEAELARLSSALSAAAGAQTVAKAILMANEAVKIAKAIQADIEEEEEAIAFLLMH